MVQAAVVQIAQPCYATEVRGLGRPTLGKGEDTQTKRGIANRLHC